MALENCLQLNTATRVCGVKCQNNSFSQRRENFHLPIHQKRLTLKKNSLLGYSNITISRKSQFVCQAREALNQVKVVTDSSWEEQVIGSSNPVLVEFWAPWCGPCRMIAPVIDELAKEYSGKVDCFKVNTDDCPNIASQYGIRSIPTVLFFKNGEKKESIIGAVPKSTLSATIDKYIDV